MNLILNIFRHSVASAMIFVAAGAFAKNADNPKTPSTKEQPKSTSAKSAPNTRRVHSHKTETKQSKTHASKKDAASVKRTASVQTSKATRRTSKKEKPCKPATITVDRGGLEVESFALVDCKGNLTEQAREKVSILVRPWGAARPASLMKHASKKAKKSQLPHDEVAPGIRLVENDLLTRLYKIANHFPNKTISIVSGYRPSSEGSLHQSAQALDFRIVGVDNIELVKFCQTLKDTGCGYYPNSSFVHMDARPEGTGHVEWIDASGPGEPPRYVTRWPLDEEDSLSEVLGADATDSVEALAAALKQTPPDAEKKSTAKESKPILLQKAVPNR